VCPANWKPGKATIIPDQDEKKKYFSEAFKNGNGGDL
jgi:alkyl hydroperoxide reductase subunit AhpC